MANAESNDAEERKVYGGVEGPDSMYVKLVSSDDMEFYIKREYALECGTIKNMLTGPGQIKDNEVTEIRLNEMPSHILRMVCEFLQYKVHYDNYPLGRPEFPMSPEICFDLLMAANFLDC